MRKLHRFLCGLFLCGASLIVPGAARGEVFQLENAGSVRGEILNPQQSPRSTYVVKTPSGGEVTLDAKQVKKVVHQSKVEMEYDRARLQYADTAAGQWELAEWCRENKLSKQRTTHLERVIALDTNNVLARRALGYENHGGKWITRDEKRESEGYVRYKNEWLLPQEVQLREERKQEDASQDRWRKTLNGWRKMLDSDKSATARSNILAIKDPLAVGALAHNLDNEDSLPVKLLYVETLSQLGTSGAMSTLAKHAVTDSEDEVRRACLDSLRAAHSHSAVVQFVQLLKSKDNSVVNRAAFALAQMKDTRAIAPLIDALITTHLFKVVKGQPGQTSSSFGKGPGNSGGSFTFGGGGVELIKQPLNNQEVLEALVELTGGTNFNYDVNAWKSWYATQKKRAAVDARRD